MGNTCEVRSLTLLRLELPERDPVSTLRSRVEKVLLVAREESIQVLVYLLLRVVDGINRLNLQILCARKTLVRVVDVEYDIENAFASFIG